MAIVEAGEDDEACAGRDLLSSIVANGASAFLTMLAITMGLMLPKMIIEWRFPMEA